MAKGEIEKVIGSGEMVQGLVIITKISGSDKGTSVMGEMPRRQEALCAPLGKRPRRRSEPFAHGRGRLGSGQTVIEKVCMSANLPSGFMLLRSSAKDENAREEKETHH